MERDAVHVVVSRGIAHRGSDAKRRPGVASTIARTPFRVTGPACRVGLVLAALLTAGWSAAQEGPARPARAREVLKNAIDCYKRGDYDAASRSLAQAQVRQDELGETERQ